LRSTTVIVRYTLAINSSLSAVILRRFARRHSGHWHQNTLICGLRRLGRASTSVLDDSQDRTLANTGAAIGVSVVANSRPLAPTPCPPRLHSSLSGTVASALQLTYSSSVPTLWPHLHMLTSMSTTACAAARYCCKAPVAASRTVRSVRQARALRRQPAASPTARSHALMCRAELPTSAEDAPLAKALPPSGAHTHVLPFRPATPGCHDLRPRPSSVMGCNGRAWITRIHFVRIAASGRACREPLAEKPEMIPDTRAR
jgi:hypothetical protein